MTSICIILPYFGKFPNYFNLWLMSAGANHDIDFLLVSDTDTGGGYTMPSNVHFLKMSLDDIRERVTKEVGFNVSLYSPYKLCDYKPVYGIVFEDYLRDYEWWGYCDSDVIFGDLRSFFTEERLLNYDRIYDLGHLTIYKNTLENNRRWKTSYNPVSYNYKEVFRVKYCKMFDERGGLWDIWKQGGWLQYCNREEVADIFVDPNKMATWYSSSKQYYEYTDGKIIGHFLDDTQSETIKEFAYIHLQKRKMVQKQTLDSHFYITFDGFYDEVCELEGHYDIPVKSVKFSEKIKKFLSIFFSDELIFHLRVALRRLGYKLSGKSQGVKYRYF